MESELSFIPFDILSTTQGREVVPVHDQLEVALGVAKTARIADAAEEAHVSKDSGTGILTQQAGISGAINAPKQVRNFACRRSDLPGKIVDECYAQGGR